MFVDPDGPDGDPNTFGDNDDRLSGDSPCIDAADNTVVPGGIVADLDGNPRFVDDPDTPDTVSEILPSWTWEPTSMPLRPAPER